MMTTVESADVGELRSRIANEIGRDKILITSADTQRHFDPASFVAFYATIFRRRRQNALLPRSHSRSRSELLVDAPNFLTAPEDLCRLTVPKDLRSCIASLSRLLGVGRPSFQESRWAQQAIFAAAPDQWFELRLGGKVTGYMQASKSHGRYSHTRPEKVTDDQIRPLEQPPTTTLRDFLADALNFLKAATNFALSLVSSGEWLGNLREYRIDAPQHVKTKLPPDRFDNSVM
jgi:hypothetical protein